MEFHFEKIPGVLISLIHIALVILSFPLIRTNAIFRTFFVWMLVNSVWTLSGAFFWISKDNFFDYAMGISLSFSPVSIFVFCYTYLKGKMPKSLLLLFLLPAIIWIPSQIIGTCKVSGKEFGIIQMPFMILFDLLSGFLLFQCYRKKSNNLNINQDKYHLGAVLFLFLNFPTIIVAGTSYYLSYFIIDAPAFLPWLGDLFIGLCSILNFIVLNSIFQNHSNSNERESRIVS
jgi:hypothetical protein